MTNLDALMPALFEFQQMVPVIKKNKRSSAFSKHEYADLERILGIIQPLLAKCELGFTFTVKDKMLNSILFHKSGQYLMSSIDFTPIETVIYGEKWSGGKMVLSPEGLKIKPETPENVITKGYDVHDIGSAITFLKRYMITAMLNLRIEGYEPDDDGNAASFYEVKKEKRKERLQLVMEAESKNLEMIKNRPK